MNINLISQRITQLCKKRGWSYYRLAKECGFEQSTLFPILHERNMPNLYTLNDICKAFDITLSDFFRCELFESDNIPTDDFFILWSQLSLSERELTKAYMSGLLHKKIDG